MINFKLGGLCALLKQLGIEEQTMASQVSLHDIQPPAPNPGSKGGIASLIAGIPAFLKQPYLVSDVDKERMLEWLRFGENVCRGLELNAALHRIALFSRKLGAPMKGGDYVAEARALREAIEGEIEHVHFYHYQAFKSAPVLHFDGLWELVVKKFPMAKADAFAAVDCWALGHGTASVFHLMRVAEYGLRALARERMVKLPKGRPLEWGEWQAVIDGIAKAVDQIANRRRGKARDAALEFYRGALGEFQAFKDAYRNNVMHSRRSYDEYEAQSVMLHVREFMNRLSHKIGENPKAIRWGKMP